MGRKNYNVSQASFIVDLESLDHSTGYFINWDEVEDTDTDGNKEIEAGTIVALKGGGIVPRKRADVSIASATEDGGTATYTATGHGLEAGDVIDITGFATTEYNQDKATVASVPDDDTFTVDGITGTPADDGAGGTASSRAMGILFEGVNEDDDSRAYNGQAVILGGVLYESLLPDSGESDFADWQTELNADLPRGFQWESYSDDRS